ncbi:DUF72 domain-containing protein [Salinisphaera japonica]|uniref:DUF72 domain-containing protein n=1 Tax=Salinisphaera japonica YTM-1 TaxID=1209778 RepID=A0A423Q2P3_9GAMM|nr:DUF72 domain-containing protein [Salinisphaera japonica]ROO32879.1 hypothetical protein SAJA_01260 [Salinisphaera japonica YTM-1]
MAAETGPAPASGSLFPDTEPAPPPTAVGAARQDETIHALGRRLPASVRLGTSSWNFPGWQNLVWDGHYTDKMLSQKGIAAYARHPLFGAVSLDRAFYQPLTAEQYRAYGEAVPSNFRYVVKAPAQVTDSLIRGTGGKGRAVNPDFLSPEQAWRLCAEPAAEGLATRLGALVFQFSPLMRDAIAQIDATIDRLHAMLTAVARVREHVPDSVLAVEVRDREWLGPRFIAALADVGATYCLGLHPRLPPIDEQLPILRRLWPGPFVCRWNLNMKHGVHGYERARADYAPFDKLVDADETTREQIARVAAGTARAGQPVFVTINNKAEGSAPCSVHALAERIVARGTQG